MHFVNDYSDTAINLAESLEAAFVRLKAALGTGEEDTFATEQQLSLAGALAGGLYRIVEGTLTVVVGGRAIAYLSEGDFFGFPSERQVPGWELHTDFAVRVERYDLATVIESMENDAAVASACNEIRDLQGALYVALFAEQCASELAIYPALRFFETGETIITEGDSGKEVFTLVEGSAEVFHQDALVGELGEDEIFGAIAALTETNRTATVVAKGRCTVAVLPVESFKNLIHSKPSTTEKLISDLAKKIIQLNKRIADMQ